MIIPKAGDFIKHRNNVDVMIKIHKVYTFSSKWIVKGTWWNIGCLSPYSIDETVKFELSIDKLVDWLICENPNSIDIRNDKWTYLNK